jgi:hypothetical protein
MHTQHQHNLEVSNQFHVLRIFFPEKEPVTPSAYEGVLAKVILDVAVKTIV